MDYKESVKQSSKELVNNPQWRVVYLDYANRIKEMRDLYSKAADVIESKLPKDIGLLRVYTAMASVLQSSRATSRIRSAYFDLRICGQSVGEIIYKGGVLLLKITSAQQNSNKSSFNIDTPKSPARKHYDFDSDEARDIISKLINIKGGDIAKMHSEEHRYESMILYDMSQKHIADKAISYCQPVVLGKQGFGFFQMRTPLAASKHNPKYSLKQNRPTGGGIDILARTSLKGPGFRFAVMELKDENLEKERPEVVMTQAVAYATFIGYLLRDPNCGNLWWNILRDQRESTDVSKHKNLDIDVVVVLPSNGPRPGHFDSVPIPDINVVLHPHTLFVDTDSDKTTLTNLSGTYCDVKKNKYYKG